MTTLGDLTQQVWNSLHSFTGHHERMTWLGSSLTDVATSVTVNNGEQISEGVIEIDDELIYVSSVATNTLTLAPFGRGYMGTTPAAHSSNAKVTYDPLFPRLEIKRALNQILAGCYPQLYRIKETTFTFAGSQTTYELPTDVEGIIKVQYQMSGPSGYWPTIFAWEFEPNSELPNGKALTFHSAPEQNSTVKVTYRAPFGALVNELDTLTSVGFPESAADVLVYGAASQLIRFLDASRLAARGVENANRYQYVASGDPAKVANQFFAIYQARLTEERKKLLEKEPPQMHATR